MDSAPLTTGFRVFGGLEVLVTKSICPQNTRKTPKSQSRFRKNLRYLRRLLLEKNSDAAWVIRLRPAVAGLRRG